MTSAPPTSFDYKPSPALFGAALLIALLALASFAISGLGMAWRIGGALVVIAFGVRGLRAFVRNPIRHVAWRGDDTLALGVERERALVELAAILIGARVFGPYVVLEIAVPDNTRQVLWLGPDNSHAETRRRLRMRIRTRAIQSPDAEAA